MDKQDLTILEIMLLQLIHDQEHCASSMLKLLTEKKIWSASLQNISKSLQKLYRSGFLDQQFEKNKSNKVVTVYTLNDYGKDKLSQISNSIKPILHHDNNVHAAALYMHNANYFAGLVPMLNKKLSELTHSANDDPLAQQLINREIAGVKSDLEFAEKSLAIIKTK